MLCLGIESTAHTFSVGIMNEKGEILSLVSDTYKPQTGGLKPVDVVEHHYACFDKVLKQAIKQAKLIFKDLTLIAFSQGPGLGPCLRVGAAVARSLALNLNIPIVGVNHCIAHVEIGRFMCKAEDPVTLYVSGGNTIISAFESGKYQIFGETIDLPIGNMIDKVARDHGISHPGGPMIEKIAKNGSKYINLPYIVKGMDLSYSGLYTATWKLIQESLSNKNEINQADLFYSLQETSFSMLTEVCERAIAHTEKACVLLTGGVAANKRLQEMIRYICAEHNVEFHVVPQKLAGDNGIMIAYTGILQYQSTGSESLSHTKILPKWRMDDVLIPWREKEAKSLVESKDMNKIVRNDNILTSSRSDNKILDTLGIQGEIIYRGAEAVLIRTKWFDRDTIIKFRLPKHYRIEEIDNKLRFSRTILEGRTLLQLSKLGIPVPAVFEIRPSSAIIIMQYIQGKKLKDIIPVLSESMLENIFRKVGKWLAKIHQYGRMHGDLTTSNIIFSDNQDLFFIDFGLTESDISIEEKAMDLHLFKQVLKSTHGNYYPRLYDIFIQGYLDEIKAYSKGYNKINGKANGKEIISRLNQIEIRGRYITKL